MPAHPRAGGENDKVRVSHCCGSGSSPRGRGKRAQTVRKVLTRGLIPARAGKTRDRTRRSANRGAHPRAGGENRAASSQASPASGSSPRGRGKPTLRDRIEPQVGLIPARAGKTVLRATSSEPLRAHPRAGGENAQGAPDHVWPVGSSPRGRGKPSAYCAPVVEGGLIPARAGKTPAGWRARTSLRAHPRAGGENTPRSSRVMSPYGSSPRGRGKRK